MNRRKFLQLTGMTLGGAWAGTTLSQVVAQDAEHSAEPSAEDEAELLNIDDLADLDNLNPALEEVLGISYDDLVASDLVSLNAPAIAESGANVPVEVNIDSVAGKINVLHAFVDRNPAPHIFSVTFGPVISQNYFTTRIRLAETGPIRMIAETEDGQYLTAATITRVTVGGCG